MFNESDFIFLITSLLLVAISYYFMVLRKKDERRKKIIEEHFNNPSEMGNTNNRVENENSHFTGGEKKNKTKSDLIKEAKKREKQQRKEARKQEIERLKKLEEDRLQKIELRDEKEKEEELAEEEKEKRIEEEKKKKEEEEYSKWKKFLTLEEEGKEIDNEKDEENLLKNFIDYIKLRKVVEIEDLAINFRLGNKETLERIKDLEKTKLLSGVLDDRGKYIYLNQEELEKIEKLLYTKGRLTRGDMREEFSKIVRLEPREEDLEKIRSYERKYEQEIDNEFEDLKKEGEEKKG